jgi:hypothetical protein
VGPIEPLSRLGISTAWRTVEFFLGLRSVPGLACSVKKWAGTSSGRNGLRGSLQSPGRLRGEAPVQDALSVVRRALAE